MLRSFRSVSLSAHIVWILTLLLISGGCVSAPRATVELAEIVDQQVQEMQASHEEFVHLYYEKLRNDVDAFMEEKWIPQFLTNVVEGRTDESKRFRADLDRAYKLSVLDWNEIVKVDVPDEDVKDSVLEAVQKLAMQEKSVLGMVLLDFAKGVQTEINKQRKQLRDRINEQETYVLDQLRSGYADLVRGTAAIKGYLAANVRLVEERDAILEKVKLLGAQNDAVQFALRHSEDAANALRIAEKAADGLDTFLKTLDEIKNRPLEEPKKEKEVE